MTSRVTIGIKTSPQGVDWATLDAVWARIGEHDAFESVWLNDHLTDFGQEGHGSSLEAIATLAALLHRVPGRWVGHAVLSNTFRHPAVLAKSATVLDHATGGRFILALGAGWHVGEHEALGIPLPPMRERFDRYESAVHVLRALWSDEARTFPGVTRPDPFYPLFQATNEPPTRTPGGPPLWLGGNRPRGLALTAAFADGWVMPTVDVTTGQPTDLDHFRDRRATLQEALVAAGRDPVGFAFGAQIPTGSTADDRRAALAQAREAVERGATHVLLGLRPSLGPDAVDAIADEVATPLRATLGERAATA
jgi:alkanesulfonate monooxygenase SsuD/methylene tetrahydromethanopterin reductase-like flavin-dependent oxidoreductase (luciferase family)